MLRTRIITAAILSCILLSGIFLLPPRASVLAFAIVFTLGAWEWARFGALQTPAARSIYALGIAMLLGVSWLWTAVAVNLMLLLGAAVAWWIIAWVWLVVRPEAHHSTATLLCGAAVLIPSFIALSRLQTTSRGVVHGPIAVLWLILLVVAADVGAYFSGRAFGRHKLAPRVSPGKTWEGAAGGLVLLALVAWCGAAHFGLPPLATVGCACLVGIFSIIGDLTESMFKRAAGLKDSGQMLPGHGGLLDRIDSVTAAAPLYALGLFGSGVIA
jgi:phosphatidate cytidylyltransferase